jgi:hypothetical protein
MLKQVVAVFLAGLVGYTTGHGALTFPTPRNAIDGALPQFKAWRYPCDAAHQGVNCTITFCGDMHNCECLIECMTRSVAVYAHLPAICSMLPSIDCRTCNAITLIGAFVCICH